MDDATPGVGSIASRCPWCSEELASAAVTVCPSCGATLTADAEPLIPGVTAVTPAAQVRISKAPTRSRLLQWISGEPGDEPLAPIPSPGSLAPPPEHIRREIRRLELEAELTNLSAEASAIAAEEALAARAANDSAAVEAALKMAADARAVSEALDTRTPEAGPLEAAEANDQADPVAGDAASVEDATSG